MKSSCEGSKRTMKDMMSGMESSLALFETAQSNCSYRPMLSYSHDDLVQCIKYNDKNNTV